MVWYKGALDALSPVSCRKKSRLDSSSTRGEPFFSSFKATLVIITNSACSSSAPITAGLTGTWGAFIMLSRILLADTPLNLRIECSAAIDS